MNVIRFYILFITYSLLGQEDLKGQSQSPSSISLYGNVINSEGEPIEMGNVSALYALDSSLIKGNYFMDGKFKLEMPFIDSLILKISSLGFIDKYKRVTIKKDSLYVNMGIIKLIENNALKEVQVFGNIPLFEQSGGNLKVNVEKTMLSLSNTTIELLSKTPNVEVNNTDISVLGKGEALIFLNNQRITYEQLAAISVKQIREIEVITNPSAKYDASGKAVIIIKTKSNTLEGLQGYVQEMLTGNYFQSSSKFGMDYKYRNISISGNYDLNLGIDFWLNEKSQKEIFTSQGIFTSNTSIYQTMPLKNRSNYRFGVGYQLDTISDLSVEYNGSYLESSLKSDAINNVISPQGLNNILETHSKDIENKYTNNISFNYNRLLDTSNSNLFIGLQYFNFFSSILDSIYELRKNINSNTINIRSVDNQNNIIVYAFQFDFDKKLKKEKIFYFGAKLSNVKTYSKVDFKSRQNEVKEWTNYPLHSTNYYYKEYIPALYSQLSGKIINLNYKLGIRSEYTISEGISKILNQRLINKKQINLFPNIELTKNLNNYNLGLNYNYRIKRPSYQDLDPFIAYLDSLTFYTGNPFLKSELTNAFEVFVRSKNRVIKLGYSNSTNPFILIANSDSIVSNKVITRLENLQSKESYYISLNIPIEIKFWTSFNTINFTYNQLKDSRPEYITASISPYLYLYSHNQFKINNLLKLELSGKYYSKNSNGIYIRDPQLTLTAGVSYSFFHEKLHVKFLVNDFLGTYHQSYVSETENILIESDRHIYTKYYRLTIDYKFGKLKKVNYKNKTVNDSELQRINQ